MNGEPAWTHQQFGDAKMTALHWAAYHNDSQVVKLLLERGARQMVNDENVAPIDVAAICHNWEVVQVFVSHLHSELSKEALISPRAYPPIILSPKEINEP